MLKIAIIGAGNIGTLMAAEFAQKGHYVTIYSSKPQCFDEKKLTVLRPDRTIMFTACIHHTTSNLEQAVQDVDIIWITYPASMFFEIASQLRPYTKPGQWIGCVPGNGGAEFAFHEHIQRGVVLFALQRVHCIARIFEYGKSVYMLGRKNAVQVGSIPSQWAPEISQVTADLFDIPCIPLPNFLTVSLTPSNPILHTARIYSMFKNYQNGTTYSDNFLFYEEWDLHSSEIMLACDNELQKLCRNLSELDLTNVIPLGIHYESQNPVEMTKKIRSITAFQGLRSPMKQIKKGWVPDFSSRYFLSDFAFGLKFIQDIAKIATVATPYIDLVLNWYDTVCIEENSISFSQSVVESTGDLYALYQ